MEGIDRGGQARQPYLTGPRFLGLMAALMLAEITCSLESNMIFVAISKLYAQYGDPVLVGWFLSAFTLTSAASAAIGGRLGDLFGRRRILLILLVIGMAGSSLSATATHVQWIIVGRVMQGATMAILPLCFGILRENVDPRHLPLGISLLGATYTISAGLGMILGGAIVDHFGWQTIFVVSASAAVIAFAAVTWLVPPAPPADPGKPLDLIGALLLAPSVALIFYGISAGRAGWFGLPGLLAISGALLFAWWIWHELREPVPLVDLRLLRNRPVALANAAVFFTAVGPMLASAAILPLLQQPDWTGAGFGFSATAAGMAQLLATVVSSSSIVAAGFLARRRGTRMVLVIGAVLSVAAWFLLASAHHDWRLVVGLLMMLVSPGAALIYAFVPHVIIEAAPPERTGEATGSSQVIRAMGNAIGAQIVALCLSTAMVAGPGGTARYPAESAFMLLYIVIGVIAIAALVAALALPADSPRRKAAFAPGPAPAA